MGAFDNRIFSTSPCRHLSAKLDQISELRNGKLPTRGRRQFAGKLKRGTNLSNFLMHRMRRKVLRNRQDSALWFEYWREDVFKSPPRVRSLNFRNQTLQTHFSVLIVDDHPLCVEALTIAARASSNSVEIHHAESISEVRERVSALAFDAILLDLSLKDSDGLDTLLVARSLVPNTPIAVVSANDRERVMRQALALGARGFISKSAPLSEMTTAINVLLTGGAWFPADLYATTGKPEVQSQHAQLSRAQLRVLAEAAKGCTNREIARALGIREPTVKTHMSAVFKVLNVKNRSQAILAVRGS